MLLTKSFHSGCVVCRALRKAMASAVRLTSLGAATFSSISRAKSGPATSCIPDGHSTPPMYSNEDEPVDGVVDGTAEDGSEVVAGDGDKAGVDAGGLRAFVREKELGPGPGAARWTLV